MYPAIVETLTIILLLADRVYRLRAARAFQQGKEVQIAALRQQMAIERRNKDTALARLYRHRYNSFKLTLDDREQITNELGEKLNQVARTNHQLENEQKTLRQQWAPKQLVNLHP